MKPNGPLLMSELLFLSIDLRKLGRSADPGSNERRRRLNCCRRPRFFGATSSCSLDSTTIVGAVVMMAGAATDCVSAGRDRSLGEGRDALPAAAGTDGTGGASSPACSFALADNCGSEAWRNLIRLKRRVMGVCSCTGGEGGRFSSFADHGARGTSLETGRAPSSDAETRSAARYSADLFRRDFSPRLKRPAGSRVLRRLRSLSLRLGRRGRKGIALAEASSSSTQACVVQRKTWHGRGWRRGEVGRTGPRERARKAGVHRGQTGRAAVGGERAARARGGHGSAAGRAIMQ